MIVVQQIQRKVLIKGKWKFLGGTLLRKEVLELIDYRCDQFCGKAYWIEGNFVISMKNIKEKNKIDINFIKIKYLVVNVIYIGKLVKLLIIDLIKNCKIVIVGESGRESSEYGNVRELNFYLL